MEGGSSEGVSDDSEDATDETAESGNRVATFDYPVTIAGIFLSLKRIKAIKAVHQIKAILKIVIRYGK